jgi:hypothetical protein
MQNLGERRFFMIKAIMIGEVMMMSFTMMQIVKTKNQTIGLIIKFVELSLDGKLGL